MNIEQKILDEFRGKRLSNKEIIEILEKSEFWLTYVEPTRIGVRKDN